MNESTFDQPTSVQPSRAPTWLASSLSILQECLDDVPLLDAKATQRAFVVVLIESGISNVEHHVVMAEV
eukprot:scaffold268_cov236-Pinguiococcus_pyrenoidosus.AAC.30